MIELTEDMRQAIDNSLADGRPVVFASVSPDGQPRLGFVGSIHVHSTNQLSIWLRKADSSSAENIRRNSKLAFLYRNPDKRQSWQFQGSARIVDDAETRQRVYDDAPEVERNFDQEMQGHAVVIDLDRVIERGQVIMER
ncbi:MAG: pyridoxamine 5'-phosphate oxidase family protein [Dehalococcoidia bacterium]